MYGIDKFDGLVQERCNSSALAMELRLSCINLWSYYIPQNSVECNYLPMPYIPDSGPHIHVYEFHDFFI